MAHMHSQLRHRCYNMNSLTSARPSISQCIAEIWPILKRECVPSYSKSILKLFHVIYSTLFFRGLFVLHFPFSSQYIAMEVLWRSAKLTELLLVQARERVGILFPASIKAYHCKAYNSHTKPTELPINDWLTKPGYIEEQVFNHL